MNNIRRKEINKVKEKLENLLADLDGLKSEEEEAYDNMPESLQESDRGEAIETLGNIY